jgi:hypothetical protein
MGTICPNDVPAGLNHINDAMPLTPPDVRLVHVGKAALDAPVAGASQLLLLRPLW